MKKSEKYSHNKLPSPFDKNTFSPFKFNYNYDLERERQIGIPSFLPSLQEHKSSILAGHQIEDPGKKKQA